MTTNLSQNIQSHVPEKTSETVEKDVRKWVESICEFKGNIEMEKCELPPKKSTKKVRKLKMKKKPSVHSMQGDTGPHQNAPKILKPKPAQKKETSKEKGSKDNQSTPPAGGFEHLKENYKNVKLPPNWVSGQSRGRLVFCRVKVLSHGSQFEMVSDRGVAITNDCMVHVFIDGPEIILNNWKLQKVETVDDVRRTIKAVDGFKVCSGTLPNGLKSPCCSIFLSGESKTCQACKSDVSQMKVAGLKTRPNAKGNQKASSFQK